MDHSSIRAKLPENLTIWRNADAKTAFLATWRHLNAFFDNQGYPLWPEPHNVTCTINSPDATLPRSGSLYASPADPRSLPTRLRHFSMHNALSRPARSREGQDVIIRILTAGEEGHNHLRILRKLATGDDSFLPTNHVLPMLQELVCEDIVFGVFPKIAVPMDRSICSWPKNSVDDILDMVKQALEGITFIHERRIAHRDLFLDNFLLDWHPQSLLLQSATRPRVYIIDFETAVEFDINTNLEDCLISGMPFPDDVYERERAPECNGSGPHCPFQSDIWQFGSGFSCFRTSIPEIDGVLQSLTDIEPTSRPTAKEASEKLREILRTLPPSALEISPAHLTCRNGK